MFKIADSKTIETRVTVRSLDEKGRATTGSFRAEFLRCNQEELDEMVNDNWRNSEVLDNKLQRVSEIGDAEGNELPADQALELVMNDVACVKALVLRYFEVMSGDLGKGRTSKRQRTTG